MTKARDLADLIAAGNPLADGAISVAEISDLTASAAELNKMDGLTASTAELNNVVGTTSALQTQLDNISVTSGSLTKSFASGETASITLAQAISPAPVVSATKEVSQAGISSKGAWDVNATASNYELHNTAYATTLLFSGSDVSTATYSQTFDASTQDGQALDAVFKTDGTKMYVLGGNNDTVYEYNLSTAWDISTSSYSNNSFSVASQENAPSSLFFKPDGTKMYTVGITSDTVYEYNLSTAWDISTASYANNGFSIASQETVPRGVSFKSDGTKMFVVGGQNDSVYEYNISTAWDVSTASYSQSLSVSAQESSPVGLHFIADGTKMYVVGAAGQDINEYSLGTAWDVSTGSFVTNFSPSSQTASPASVFFETNGTKMFVSDTYTGEVIEYDIATLLTLGTGSFAATDLGKRIVGNGGDVTLTSTAGAYSTTGGSAFTDNSTIASGSWSMRGLKSAGDADGVGMTGNASIYSVSSSSFVSSMTPPSGSSHRDVRVSPDGTLLFTVEGTTIQRMTLSTAYDITTASASGSYNANGVSSSFQGFAFSANGQQLYLIDQGGEQIHRVYFSTGFTLSNESPQTSIGVYLGFSFGIDISDNGQHIYVCSANGLVTQKVLVNAYNSGGGFSASHQLDVGAENFGDRLEGVSISPDGTKLLVAVNPSTIAEYTLSTPYYVNSATLTASYSTASKTTYGTGVDWLNSGSNFVVSSIQDGSSVSEDKVHMFTSSSSNLPTSQYHIAVTNSGGQIATNFWSDINSMTADQAAGDGTVHYAVSTDDRTTWSVAKASDGVRPIVRDNSGTWQYNNDAGLTYNIANAVYANKSFDASAQASNTITSMEFNSNGSKMYVLEANLTNTNDYIYQYSLSTNYDVSSASYDSKSLQVGTRETTPTDLAFNNDGTKVYVLGYADDFIETWTLSTAYDVSTASYASQSFNISGQEDYARGFTFNNDGTKMYVVGNGSSRVSEYSLSTAFNVSTATYTDNFNPTNESTIPFDMRFNSDGTKMFILMQDVVYQYSLSVAYDVSTGTYDSVSWSIPSNGGSFRRLSFGNGGSMVAIPSSDTGEIYQYSTLGFSTSTTWANATTNDEFYALQQALGATSVNRMDKTQLDAVADGSHFTLGDTLDLAIALRQDTASASTPKSDGVSINYDAQALNQGAVLGTDYDYDFPNSTTVRVTSNAAQNLKVRVV